MRRKKEEQQLPLSLPARLESFNETRIQASIPQLRDGEFVSDVGSSKITIERSELWNRLRRRPTLQNEYDVDKYDCSNRFFTLTQIVELAWGRCIKETRADVV